MSASIKICTRRSFRNRRGACSEIEEAFAFSKVGLLRDHEVGLLKDHEGRSQKSKRLAFSKAGLLRDHEGRSQKSKRHLLFQPCQHLSHALSFAEIMGILSKISGETSKHAQPLLTFEKTLPTRLLAPKSKRHRPPNLESQTLNMITFSKIEERTSKHAQPLLTFEKTLSTRLFAPKLKRHRPPNLESHSQHDYFLKNRRDTAPRISRARPPAGLLSQKSKRHRSPNLESQIPDRIACSKTEEAPLSQLQELDLLG
ncbi:hypothetical protein ACFX15_046228 [Malus domestica]